MKSPKNRNHPFLSLGDFKEAINYSDAGIVTLPGVKLFNLNAQLLNSYSYSTDTAYYNNIIAQRENERDRERREEGEEGGGGGRV